MGGCDGVLDDPGQVGVQSRKVQMVWGFAGSPKLSLFGFVRFSEKIVACPERHLAFKDAFHEKGGVFLRDRGHRFAKALPKGKGFTIQGEVFESVFGLQARVGDPGAGVDCGGGEEKPLLKGHNHGPEIVLQVGFFHGPQEDACGVRDGLEAGGGQVCVFRLGEEKTEDDGKTRGGQHVLFQFGQAVPMMFGAVGEVLCDAVNDEAFCVSCCVCEGEGVGVFDEDVDVRVGQRGEQGQGKDGEGTRHQCQPG